MASSNNYVPKDYEDLYTHYIDGNQSLAANLVKHFVPYATAEDREDLIQSVFVRCMDKDVISIFNPDKANFGGVIYFVTRTVCCNFLDKRSRNPLTGLNSGTIVETAEEFEPGQYALENVFGTVDPETSEGRMDAQKMIEKMVDFAKAAFAIGASKRDQSLLPMIEMLMEGYLPKEIAPKLGVTSSTVYNWMEALKAAVIT